MADTTRLNDWPNVGDRVTCTTNTARRGWLEAITVEGVVIAHGCGVYSHFTLDNGHHIIPTLGDTWTVTAPGAAAG